MSASVQMVLHFDTDVPFPHVSSVSMLFTEKFVVQFSTLFYVQFDFKFVTSLPSCGIH